jgi:hypothetical protein
MTAHRGRLPRQHRMGWRKRCRCWTSSGDFPEKTRQPPRGRACGHISMLNPREQKRMGAVTRLESASEERPSGEALPTRFKITIHERKSTKRTKNENRLKPLIEFHLCMEQRGANAALKRKGRRGRNSLKYIKFRESAFTRSCRTKSILVS